MTVKFYKSDDTRWVAYNTKTNKTAEVHKFNDSYGFIKNPSRYRVDVNGRTVKSMIDHFQTAKSAAIKAVK